MNLPNLPTVAILDVLLKTHALTYAEVFTLLATQVAETKRLRALLTCREGTDDGATCRELDARDPEGEQAPCYACSAQHATECPWHEDWDLCSCGGQA